MKIKEIFILLFFVLIVLPLVLIDRKTNVSLKENRNLAPAPRLIEDGKINFRFPLNFENYINDRFGGRNQLVRISSGIQFGLLEKLFNSKVIIGRDSWLFSLNGDATNYELYDFLKLERVTEADTQKFYERIRSRSDWCKKNGIEFIFVIVPCKHNVYPEYYPFDRPAGPERTETLVASVPQSIQPTIIYLKDYLISKKDKYAYPLYTETDWHWNNEGAREAFELLQEKIKNYFPGRPYPELKYSRKIDTIPATSALVPLLGLPVYGTLTSVEIAVKGGPDIIYGESTDPVSRVGKIKTESSNRGLPRALIFHDSQFNFVQPFISNIFSDAEYQTTLFFETDKEYILEFKPDIIILELWEPRTGTWLEDFSE
jgi:hypothetical protein